MSDANPGVDFGTAHGKIVIDTSSLHQVQEVARQTGASVTRSMRDMAKETQAQLKIAATQARESLVVQSGLQARLTAETRAQAAARTATAKAESTAYQQAARIAYTQAQQAARITAQTQIQQARVAAQEQIQQSKAAAQVQIQQAKAAASGVIEEQRRVTAAHKSELREQAAAQQATAQRAQSSGGGGGGGIFGGGLVGGIARIGAVGAVIGLAVRQANELGQNAAEMSRLATSYERQNAAALQLAGSQARLNTLLEAYSRATGGVIDRATALGDVTKLQALGFADSTKELEKFVRVSRGISIATGQSQEYVVGQLQLAISNMSTQRLDQLGLGVAEVKERIDELRSSTRGMTEEAAYMDAVLGLADEKFGRLTTSAAAQATGVEKLTRSWKDFWLEVSRVASGPINGFAGWISQGVEATTNAIQQARNNAAINSAGSGVVAGGLTLNTSRAGAQGILDSLLAERTRLLDPTNRVAGDEASVAADLATLDAKISAATITLAGFDAAVAAATRSANGADYSIGARTGVGAFQRDGMATTATSAGRSYTDEQTDIITDWYQARTELERNANRQLLDASRQYYEQRASTIRAYELSMSREAEDFARQRARQEQELQNRIADVYTDSARQRATWERDLAQSIGKAQADSAERVAGYQRDHDESIAEARQKSAKRIAEQEKELEERIVDAREDSQEKISKMEVDYAKARTRAAAESADRIGEAMARLDARALREEQRRFERETADAAEAHNEAIADERTRLDDYITEQQEAHKKAIAKEKENLQETIDEQNKAHKRRLEDEQKNLEKSIAQQQAAHAQRLADAEAADAQRIEKMKADAEERQRVEDEDRSIRLGRMATDHDNQLAEIDRQHGLRIAQINQQMQEERNKLDEGFRKQLEDHDLHHIAWMGRQKALQAAALTAFDEWWKEITGRIESSHPSEADPYEKRQALEDERKRVVDAMQRIQDAAGGDPNVYLKDTEWKRLDRELQRIDGELNNLAQSSSVYSAASIAKATIGTSPKSINGSFAPTGMAAHDMRFYYPIEPVAQPMQMASGASSVTYQFSFGDINPTLVLDGAGNRSDADLKRLMGEALTEWVEEAANYGMSQVRQ